MFCAVIDAHLQYKTKKTGSVTMVVNRPLYCIDLLFGHHVIYHRYAYHLFVLFCSAFVVAAAAAAAAAAVLLL